MRRFLGRFRPTANHTWQVGTLTYTSTGLVVLFCWLLWGDFAWSMKERSVAPILQLLLRKFESTDMLAGLLIGTLPAVIGLMFGPIISYRSDRHRGRWGRRIPYLMITTPVATLAILGLALSPVIGQWLHGVLGHRSYGLNPTILMCFGFFWTVFEFATIAANAVFAGLINDVVPRPLLGRFYGMFRALSLIDGIIFNFWLLGKAEEHYVWIFVGVSILYGGGFTLMCLKVKEGDYPPPPPPSALGLGRGFIAAAKLYFRECFAHSYYRWVFFAFMLANLAFMPFNLFSVFFAKSVGMPMDNFGKYAALVYMISLSLSYGLGALADRFHPLRMSIAALTAYAGVTLWGGFYATDADTFGIALVLHGVIAGAFLTSSASLGQRLFPHATFAQFASAAAVILALGSMVLAPAVGQVLDITNHTYRYTLWIGSGISALAVLSNLVVYRKFMRLGGPGNYVPPGEYPA